MRRSGNCPRTEEGARFGIPGGRGRGGRTTNWDMMELSQPYMRIDVSLYHVVSAASAPREKSAVSI